MKIIKNIFSLRGTPAKVLLACSVGALLVLDFFDYFLPAQSFLDNETLSFHIGETRLSVYILIKALLLVVLTFWVTNIISDFSERKIRSVEHMRISTRTLLVKLVQISLYFLAFLFVLNTLGIDLTGLAIFGGAVGIGLGFGLQKITSNFISGLILLIEKSIEEGDLVEFDDKTIGFVRKSSARYTMIETFESREIMIPNEDFITSRVTNWTYTNTQGRIEIPVGVSYGSDLNLVYRLILDAASSYPRCSKNPGPECFLTEFGDSSVNFILYFWVDNILEGRKRPTSDILFSIWNAFEAHNIEIPFPQRDIHIKNPEALR